MKPWVSKALELLGASLEPPQHEYNEIDWKITLSSDSKRLADHLGAFSNYPGGGYLAFGISSDSTLEGVTTAEIEQISNRIVNIGRDALEPSLQLDHYGINFKGVDILLVHIPESTIKPVHRRGQSVEDAFIRSCGTTRKASRLEIGKMMLHSKNIRWENLHASVLLKDEELLEVLAIDPIFRMLDQPIPYGEDERLRWMEESAFIERHPSGGGYVTNLGAISAATDLKFFPELEGKGVRVIVYDGFNKIKSRSDTVGRRGYALAFESLLKFVCNLVPKSEVIEQALRQEGQLHT